MDFYLFNRSLKMPLVSRFIHDIANRDISEGQDNGIVYKNHGGEHLKFKREAFVAFEAKNNPPRRTASARNKSKIYVNSTYIIE